MAVTAASVVAELLLKARSEGLDQATKELEKLQKMLTDTRPAASGAQRAVADISQTLTTIAGIAGRTATVVAGLSGHFGTLGQVAGTALGVLGPGGMVGAITGLTAVMITSAKVAADYGDQVDRLSFVTGISVDKLSGLRRVAEESGTTLDGLAGSIRFLSRNLDEAKSSFELGTLFRDLGVDIRQGVEQVLPEVAKGLLALESPIERNVAAMRVFGRSFQEILPFMRQLATEGIDPIVAKSREMGDVMSSEGVERAKAFKTAMSDFTASLRATEMAIGTAVLPVLTELLRAMGLVVQGASELTKPLASLIEPLNGIAFAADAAKIALIALGSAAVLASLVAVGKAIAAIGVAMAAALGGPVGLLVIGLVTALGYLAIKYGDTRDAAERLNDALQRQAELQARLKDLDPNAIMGGLGKATDVYRRALEAVNQEIEELQKQIPSIFTQRGERLGDVLGEGEKPPPRGTTLTRTPEELAELQARMTEITQAAQQEAESAKGVIQRTLQEQETYYADSIGHVLEARRAAADQTFQVEVTLANKLRDAQIAHIEKTVLNERLQAAQIAEVRSQAQTAIVAAEQRHQSALTAISLEGYKAILGAMQQNIEEMPTITERIGNALKVATIQQGDLTAQWEAGAISQNAYIQGLAGIVGKLKDSGLIAPEVTVQIRALDAAIRSLTQASKEAGVERGLIEALGELERESIRALGAISQSGQELAAGAPLVGPLQAARDAMETELRAIQSQIETMKRSIEIQKQGIRDKAVMRGGDLPETDKTKITTLEQQELTAVTKLEEAKSAVKTRYRVTEANLAVQAMAQEAEMRILSAQDTIKKLAQVEAKGGEEASIARLALARAQADKEIAIAETATDRLAEIELAKQEKINAINATALTLQQRQLDATLNAHIIAAQKSGDAWTAFWAGFLRALNTVPTEMQALVNLSGSIARDLTRTFEESFFQIFKGNLESVKDAWESFMDSLLRELARFLSSLVVRQFLEFAAALLGLTQGGTISLNVTGGGPGGVGGTAANIAVSTAGKKAGEYVYSTAIAPLVAPYVNAVTTGVSGVGPGAGMPAFVSSTGVTAVSEAAAPIVVSSAQIFAEGGVALGASAAEIAALETGTYATGTLGGAGAGAAGGAGATAMSLGPIVATLAMIGMGAYSSRQLRKSKPFRDTATEASGIVAYQQALLSGQDVTDVAYLAGGYGTLQRFGRRVGAEGLDIGEIPDHVRHNLEKAFGEQTDAIIQMIQNQAEVLKIGMRQEVAEIAAGKAVSPIIPGLGLTMDVAQRMGMGDEAQYEQLYKNLHRAGEVLGQLEVPDEAKANLTNFLASLGDDTLALQDAVAAIAEQYHLTGVNAEEVVARSKELLDLTNEIGMSVTLLAENLGVSVTEITSIHDVARLLTEQLASGTEITQGMADTFRFLSDKYGPEWNRQLQNSLELLGLSREEAEAILERIQQMAEGVTVPIRYTTEGEPPPTRGEPPPTGGEPPSVPPPYQEPPEGKQHGGWVRGRFGLDAVGIRATAGEYVVRRPIAGAYASELETLNATGAWPAADAAGVTVNIYGANLTPAQLEDMVRRALGDALSRRRERGASTI